MGIFLKLCISINSNGASVDRTAETREKNALTNISNPCRIAVMIVVDNDK